MRKAKVIRGKELEWEPGRDADSSLMIKHGICAKTVGNPALKMGHTIVPAGASNARHHHSNCDVGIHMLKGRLKWFLGSDDEMEEVIVEKGDFAFIPAGTMHGLTNPSDTEPAEFLSVKNVSDAKEEGTVIAEPDRLGRQNRAVSSSRIT